jgi:4-aminobutyrate aminotransferase-like enzyme
VDVARQQIEASTVGSLAAILVEPIQGTAGNVVPPPDWLPAIAEMARELGALLIVDEMITGFGRTGAMFGFEHTDTLPDILTIGKGFGGGYPVTGVVTTDALSQSNPWSKPSSSSSSVGGNPLAAAAALATVETILEEDLVSNARQVGAHMLERLQRMQERFHFIGDVRGRGLLLGMDMVADRETKQPLPTEIMQRIYCDCVERGLLLMTYSSRVRINPPLVITEPEAEAGLDILESVFADLGA